MEKYSKYLVWCMHNLSLLVDYKSDELYTRSGLGHFSFSTRRLGEYRKVPRVVPVSKEYSK